MAQQSVFGAGYLWGTLPSGTPRLFAALQDVTVDFSRDLKPLWGSNQYAIEQGVGKAKIECKASMARFDPAVFNDLYFGGTKTTGQTNASNMEAGTVPSTPYQITVANSATWVTDLGVYDTTIGKFLQNVSPSSPSATGQYKVAAGVYTFYSADAAHTVQISYTYTIAGTGYTVATGNPAIGATAQIFRADLFNSYRGAVSGITLLACQTSKLGMPFKQEDWMMTSFDFSAQDDGTGAVAKVYGVGGFTV